MINFFKKMIYFFKVGYLLRVSFPKVFLATKTFFLLSQRPEARKLLSLMKKEKYDFIDIGAFHGVYTNLALHSKNCANIISVEANFTNYQFLKKIFNSKDVNLKNNIFSSKPGELSFFIPVLDQSQYGRYENGLGSGISGRFKNEVEIKVKSINLAELISCLNTNNKSLILKVDVEGMEGEFIKNLHSTNLSYDRIVLLIEITNKDFQKYSLELEKQGFDLFFSGNKYQTQDHIFIKNLMNRKN